MIEHQFESVKFVCLLRHPPPPCAGPLRTASTAAVAGPHRDRGAMAPVRTDSGTPQPGITSPDGQVVVMKSFTWVECNNVSSVATPGLVVSLRQTSTLA